MKLIHLLEAEERTILDLELDGYDNPIIKDSNGKIRDPYLEMLDIEWKELTSLKHCPKKVEGNFSCNNNHLTSLEDCPSIIKGHFYCSGNHLTSLEYCPKEITSEFYCDGNQLTSLKGCPSIIEGVFGIQQNHLTSLEGCPSIIKGDFYCSENRLTSLKGIHHHIKHIGGTAKFYAVRGDINSNYKITSHILGLMKIEGLQSITFHDEVVEKIINKHLQGNVNGCNLGACQDELEDKGYEDYAQL